MVFMTPLIRFCRIKPALPSSHRIKTCVTSAVISGIKMKQVLRTYGRSTAYIHVAAVGLKTALITPVKVLPNMRAIIRMTMVAEQHAASQCGLNLVTNCLCINRFFDRNTFVNTYTTVNPSSCHKNRMIWYSYGQAKIVIQNQISLKVTKSPRQGR